jgi:hypothetical protein
LEANEEEVKERLPRNGKRMGVGVQAARHYSVAEALIRKKRFVPDGCALAGFSHVPTSSIPLDGRDALVKSVASTTVHLNLALKSPMVPVFCYVAFLQGTIILLLQRKGRVAKFTVVVIPIFLRVCTVFPVDQVDPL